MLHSLALRDFVIVDQLELDFTEGFSVLTGETGAGKSILLDALGLALGNDLTVAKSVRAVNARRLQLFLGLITGLKQK